MTLSNRAYALLGFGQWCRNHGIYEIREVLVETLGMAEAAQSGEDLAIKVEEAAFRPKPAGGACSMPEPKPQEQKTTSHKTKAKS